VFSPVLLRDSEPARDGDAKSARLR
jgi:hypothetical protein